jgi:hypothetical protein
MEDRVALALLGGEVTEGQTIKVDVADDGLVIS